MSQVTDLVCAMGGNKVQSAMAHVLPEQVKARQHGKMMEPGSAEKAKKKKQ